MYDITSWIVLLSSITKEINGEALVEVCLTGYVCDDACILAAQVLYSIAVEPILRSESVNEDYI